MTSLRIALLTLRGEPRRYAAEARNAEECDDELREAIGSARLGELELDRPEILLDAIESREDLVVR
jgi:hypothetical protein